MIFSTQSSRVCLLNKYREHNTLRASSPTIFRLILNTDESAKTEQCIHGQLSMIAAFQSSHGVYAL